MTDLTNGNIEDIERHLRAPATSFRELLLAGAAFAVIANDIDALPLRASDDSITGVTVGDLRKLRDALVAAGWRKDEV